MSRAATESLIHAYLDAFNAGDSDAMLSLMDDDIAHDINQGGREIGVEKFRWFNAVMKAHYRETLQDIVVMSSPDGMRAAAEFTVKGEYLSTADGLPEANGQRYSLPAGIFFEIDDGRITRVTTHYNLKDWIAQVEAD
ncbi:MAG: nuclear transport factor 2 family protein [Rhizobiaceae bacterium]|jgi:steroid delta-isomerase-like uncharacterized protein|nr:nuclear transport factor 2 family protein [Rhizobiaceae bacterium]